MVPFNDSSSFGLLNGHLLGNNYTHGRPYFLFVFRLNHYIYKHGKHALLFVILVISHFGFEGWIWVIIS